MSAKEMKTRLMRYAMRWISCPVARCQEEDTEGAGPHITKDSNKNDLHFLLSIERLL